MAKRHENHKIGSLGELHIARMFEELGYACSAISPDYGEDFFVFGESNGIIEPFKIFVQVRASSQADRRPSAWTEYEDPLTVRNWVLGNELVILVRHNFTTVTTRYCVPEEDILYWEIDPRRRVPLRCLHEFNSATVEELIWRARIRHYDRIVRITQPNEFEKSTWKDIPQFRLFVLELLFRLGFIDRRTGALVDEVYTLQFSLTMEMLQNHEDSPDMSAVEKARYAACCLIVLTRLKKVSGCPVGLSPFLLDKCAVLLTQLARHRRNEVLASQIATTEQP